MIELERFGSGLVEVVPWRLRESYSRKLASVRITEFRGGHLPDASASALNQLFENFLLFST